MRVSGYACGPNLPDVQLGDLRDAPEAAEGNGNEARDPVGDGESREVGQRRRGYLCLGSERSGSQCSRRPGIRGPQTQGPRTGSDIEGVPVEDDEVKRASLPPCTLDPRPWTQDPGPWTPEPGPWTPFP